MKFALTFACIATAVNSVSAAKLYSDDKLAFPVGDQVDITNQNMNTFALQNDSVLVVNTTVDDNQHLQITEFVQGGLQDSNGVKALVFGGTKKNDQFEVGDDQQVTVKGQDPNWYSCTGLKVDNSPVDWPVITWGKPSTGDCQQIKLTLKD